MTQIRSQLLLIVVSAFVLTSCQPGGTESAPSSTETTAKDSAALSEPAPTTSEEVAYEPAYPSDVSDEGLSKKDFDQQEQTHSHGGEEHSHGDEDNTHDEEGDHDGHEH